MITGEIKGQIDRIWDAFATGGIANPIEVIEQIGYFLFLRRLDDSIEAPVPRFLSAFLASLTGQGRVASRHRQAVKAGLELEDIRALTVPRLPIELQREFVRRAEAVAQLKASHRASPSEVDALFASPQHRAFRGELFA